MSLPQATTSFPFASPDLTRSWIDLEFPSLTIATLLEAQHKNAAALADANQAAFDGLKTLVQRQGFHLTASVDTCTKVTSDLLTAESFEERAAKQADATRDAYVSIVARVRELSDIVIEANVTALGIVNARMIEAFGELKALFSPPAAAAATGEAPALALPGLTAAREEIAAVEEVIFPVKTDPTTVTTASTTAPEAAAPEAEAVAAPTAPPQLLEPEAEVASPAAPTISPETAAPEAEVAAAPTPRPKTAPAAAKAAASPARPTPKTPPNRPPRRPSSR